VTAHSFVPPAELGEGIADRYVRAARQWPAARDGQAPSRERQARVLSSLHAVGTALRTRDRSLKGWLVTVAKREAWRLNALDLREREAVRGEDLPMDPFRPRDRHAEAFEFRAAIDELKKLPPLLQGVVVMHSIARMWRI
jgi:hypothetical protein